MGRKGGLTLERKRGVTAKGAHLALNRRPVPTTKGNPMSCKIRDIFFCEEGKNHIKLGLTHRVQKKSKERQAVKKMGPGGGKKP